MASNEDQLIQQLTQRVLAVLRERGLAPAPGSPAPGTPGASDADASPADSPAPEAQGRAAGYGTASRRKPGAAFSPPVKFTDAAPTRPPIGVCTGDYSQFPELKGRLHGDADGDGDARTPAPHASDGAVAAQPEAAPVASAPAPLTGIVTAAQLQAALDVAAGAKVRLASAARVTPLGADLIRQHPEKFERVTASSASPASSPSAGPAGQAAPAGRGGADGPAWLWWIDGRCPAVAQLTAERRGRMRPVVTVGRSSSPAGVLRDIAEQVKARQAAGGVLFVPQGAVASCYANRSPALRAVLGTDLDAVDLAARELGANLLILEYPRHGYRSMAAMVDRVIASDGKAPVIVHRDLAEMHRTG